MADSRPRADEIIAVYEQAAKVNLGNPLRQGNVVELAPPQAEEVVLTADLHGHRENFEAICSITDLKRFEHRHLVLQEVCHGGPAYAGGGCMSHMLLEDSARLVGLYPGRVHFILSNHELAELMDYPIRKGQQMLNLNFRCGLHQAYGDEAETVRHALLEFLRSCPLAVRLSSGAFVCHSIPEGLDRVAFDASIFSRELVSEDFEEHSSLFNLVWGRDYRPENAERFAKLVKARVLINGHDPCPHGFKVPNRTQVLLDCCSSPATYLMLPVGEPLSQQQIIDRIAKLPGDGVSHAGCTQSESPPGATLRNIEGA